jgi:uncharacterized protein YjiS (DUF1127 family)
MATRIQVEFPVLSDLTFRKRSRQGANPGRLGWIRAVAARWHERRVLEQLDERSLCDIGISRSQALAEARKPCWRR